MQKVAEQALYESNVKEVILTHWIVLEGFWFHISVKAVVVLKALVIQEAGMVHDPLVCLLMARDNNVEKIVLDVHSAIVNVLIENKIICLLHLV